MDLHKSNIDFLLGKLSSVIAIYTSTSPYLERVLISRAGSNSVRVI